MRKNQWNILGAIFFLISLYFFSWTLPSMTGAVTILSVKTIQDAAVWIVNRIYSIAYLITFGFAVACWINAWLEHRAEKKEKTK